MQIRNYFEVLTFRFYICKLSIFMSVKLLKLQWRIFFWTITGRIKKIHSRLELSLTKGNHENILIVFPMDEPTFRVALYAFRELGQTDLQKKRFRFQRI